MESTIERGGAWKKLHSSEEANGASYIWPTTWIWMHSSHQKISLQELKHTKF
jgi:hypothetical protein